MLRRKAWGWIVFAIALGALIVASAMMVNGLRVRPDREMLLASSNDSRM